MIQVLVDTATRSGEADRDMIVLALAHLAVERPGWQWTCRDMAVQRFDAGDLFDNFERLHVLAIALAPKQP